MEQKDKELLLKDLAARLPYGVKVFVDYYSTTKTKEMGIGTLHDFIYDNVDIRPYLRPMSSMTEEEAIYYDTIFTELKFWQKTDWLNKHNFDFRGLIEKGLALPAPEGMYKTE